MAKKWASRIQVDHLTGVAAYALGLAEKTEADGDRALLGEGNPRDTELVKLQRKVGVKRRTLLEIAADSFIGGGTFPVPHR